MPIDVVQTAPNDWDDYVEAHRNATAYHRGAAVVIGEQAFGLRTYFLCARDTGGRLQGILPLVRQSSWVFGRFLTSVPFFTYGGVLADDLGIAHELIREAGHLGEAEKVRHVELRHRSALELNLPQRLDKVSMVLPLPKTIEELSASLGSKLRSQIRRAERETLEIAWGGSELLDEFYAIFAASMHRLGTPVYPRHFFDYVLQAFCVLLCVVLLMSVC
jgi:FemAB-related protein (PEP-CTERM system-associated)